MLIEKKVRVNTRLAHEASGGFAAIDKCDDTVKSGGRSCYRLEKEQYVVLTESNIECSHSSDRGSADHGCRRSV